LKVKFLWLKLELSLGIMTGSGRGGRRPSPTMCGARANLCCCYRPWAAFRPGLSCEDWQWNWLSTTRRCSGILCGMWCQRWPG